MTKAPSPDDAALAAALRIVHTTVGSEADAARLARALVEARLAACVQIAPVRSVYRWQGAVHDEHEVGLACKTVAARVPALMAAMRSMHPYELPAIEVVAPTDADPAFAAWVHGQSSDEAG